MMRWLRRVAFSVFAGSALTVLQMASASAAAIQNEVPAPPFFLNACNGELVETTGTVHLVAVFDVTNPGHSVFRANYQDVKGIGVDTGTRYVVAGTGQIHEYFNLDHGQDVFTYIEILRVISMGSAPNSSVTISFHQIVTPSGQTTTASYGEAGCSG